MKEHETASPAPEGKRPSELIDGRIEELGAGGEGGWRGRVLAQVRAIIRKADARIVEEWKWRGTPVWSLHGAGGGIVCTGEPYKSRRAGREADLRERGQVEGPRWIVQHEP